MLFLGNQGRGFSLKCLRLDMCSILEALKARRFILTGGIVEFSELQEFVCNAEVLNCECVAAYLFVKTATFSVAAFEEFSNYLPIAQAVVLIFKSELLINCPKLLDELWVQVLRALGLQIDFIRG